MKTSEENLIEEIIKAGEEFLKETETTTRYLSWQHCYALFNEYLEYKKSGEKYKNEVLQILKQDDNLIRDYLTLYLAFYLASWGMYRGSTFLIDRDYKVHRSITDYILDNYNILKEIDSGNIDKFDEVVYGLKKIYAEEKINDKIDKNNKEQKEIVKKISDTLISKVLLGTMGIIPAYDRYFIETLTKINKIRKENGKERIVQKLNSNSIRELVELYQERFKDNNEFKELCVKSKYPIMKVLDMCFWKYGYNMSNDIILIGKDEELKETIEETVKEIKKTIRVICVNKNYQKIDAIPGVIKLRLENGKIYNWETQIEIKDYIKEIKEKLKK